MPADWGEASGERATGNKHDADDDDGGGDDHDGDTDGDDDDEGGKGIRVARMQPAYSPSGA